VLLGRETLATTTTQPAHLVAKIPPTLSFTDAATLPLAYATALHALLDVGRLESEHTVLVHKAASGLGMAAIQTARMVGARVLATAESDEQASLLTDEFGLQRGSDLWVVGVHPGSESFVDGVMRATAGRGADVVLNLLAGDMLHASWRCVAECGTMVDLVANTTKALSRGGSTGLEMHPFRQSRSYSAVDLDHLRTHKAALVGRHLQHVVKLYRDGRIAVIRPAAVFPASKVAAAFAHARTGTGKAVVEVRPETGEAAYLPSTVPSPEQPSVVLDRHGSYLVAGGLGGIGRQVVLWLAEQGAGNLILLSRSAGSLPDHTALADELRSIGAGVQLVRGNVANLRDVEAAVAGATYPVRGLVQMSAVLRDGNWSDMTVDDWQTVTAPKVEGTWNLHQATLAVGAPLDFFITFGSISAVVGQPGQANYVAANAFLDAFTLYRRGRGLPATTIDVGIVEDLGLAARRSGFISGIKSMGFLTVREGQILDAMSLAIINRSSPSPNFVIGLGSSTPLSSPDNRLFWRRDPRMAVYHSRAAAGGDSGAGGGSGSAGIKAFLTAARNVHQLLKAPETAVMLAVEIGKRVLALLGKPADDLQTSLGLSDLGMDSLVGIEMRKWWKTTFGFDVSLLEMLGMGTLEVLGKFAVDGLCKLSNVE
jgi:NADPH:quinone reductase-like Zn-dependent oxidoreductase/aryl carrier-like protein